MTPVAPGKLLSAWNLTPKHHFGQNFLCNPEITEKIAERVIQGNGGTAIEIGAGLGALTSPLLKRATRVIAIERDRDLVPILNSLFADAIGEARLTILEQDAKTTDYARLFSTEPAPYFLAGNLPYQLTGPLLRRTVELAKIVHRVVFMVQLEVAARLCAAPGTRAYGALSVFGQACFSIERLWVIKPGAFFPQPKVDSAVIEFIPRHPAIAEETSLFRAVVQAAFSQRRKKLRNAWGQLPNVSAAQLQLAASRCDVDLNERGEMLDVAAFARMTQELEQC
jgi:16S rRNA (adenine1518-N6/adenine1519-N6)-dimethyltransferase